MRKRWLPVRKSHEVDGYDGSLYERGRQLISMSDRYSISRKKKMIETYNRGRKRFLILHGVLLYGLSCFILFTAIQHCRITDGRVQFIPITGSELLVNLLVWLLGGYLFGLLGWKRIERLHAKIHN